MIEKWEIIPDPSDNFPGRYRVSVVASIGDIQPLSTLFPRKAGKPWALRRSPYRFSFYFYDPTPEDRDVLERFMTGKPVSIPASPMEIEPQLELTEPQPESAEPPPEPPAPPLKQPPVAPPKDPPPVEVVGRDAAATDQREPEFAVGDGRSHDVHEARPARASIALGGIERF